MNEEYLPPSRAYQEEEKSPFKKIMKINFIIFLVYYVIALFLLRSSSRFGEMAFLFIFLYPLQSIINFIAGGVSAFAKNGKSSAFFLAGFLILIIGFGACFFAIIGAF